MDELISKSIGATPTKIYLLGVVFKILIFHLYSSIDLSNSFSHIVPANPFGPILVIIFLFSPVIIYFLFSFILFGHSLNEYLL